MKVLFLDFDGVIRVRCDWSDAPDKMDFCPDRMRRVAQIVAHAGASIVVSSDWRLLEEERAVLRLMEPSLMRELFHEDWSTPVSAPRWKEIQMWLLAHPEVTSYAILDDFATHFEGAPQAMMERLVLCSNRHGLVPQLVGRTAGILNRL